MENKLIVLTNEELASIEGGRKAAYYIGVSAGLMWALLAPQAYYISLIVD